MNIKRVHIDLIKPYWRNPRKNEKAIESVKESIKKYGYNQPIVVDEEYVIIVGHTRCKALRELGYEEIDVIVKTDLSEDKAKQYRIADNKASEKAEWDEDLLMYELREIETTDDMSIFFNEGELDMLLEIEDDLNLDDSPTSIDETYREETQATIRAEIRKEVSNEYDENKEELEKEIEARVQAEMREQIREEVERENQKIRDYEEKKKAEFVKKSDEKEDDYIEIECPHCDEKYVLSRSELLRAGKLQRTV